MHRSIIDVGTCRFCGLPLENLCVLDECDRPVDWYRSRDQDGVLDAICYSDAAPDRDCDICEGSGDRADAPGWPCESCTGTGVVADHQPA